MIFHSIRWRLQAWHGLILVVVLTAFGLSAFRVAWDNQLRRVDQELDYRMGSLFFKPRPGPKPPEGPPDQSQPGRPSERRRGGGPPDTGDFLREFVERIETAGANDSAQTNGFYYIFWQDNALTAKSPNAPADVPPPAQQDPWSQDPGSASRGKESQPRPFAPPRDRGDVREMFRFLPHGSCVLVGHNMEPEFAAMRRLAIWLTMAGAGVLLLGWAGGWWVSTRAMRPIEQISATATKIAAGDLSQRINTADTDNELGRLAAVLNSTFGRLEAAFANQARFTADASHELRTPLSVIVSQTQTALSRERSAQEYRDALQACHRAAQRMRSLAESLLDLARLDAGQAQLRSERFDLSQVVSESVQLLQPLATERGVEIRCELTPTFCMADAQRISQVTTNLLSNAIHFNRERGTVLVSAYTVDGSSILSISDTGEGIPAQDLPHIFERFYRVDKSRSRSQGRAGLGLAIAKAIVDAHGGTLEAQSQPGKGSTFTVKLRSS